MSEKTRSDTHRDQKKQLETLIQQLTTQLTQDETDAILHNNIGNAYKQLHNDALAKIHYEKAITYQPQYPEAHHNLGNLYAADNYQAALKHYHQALLVAPDYISAHYNLGLLFLNHAKYQEAATQFNNVVNLDAKYGKASFYLGILALQNEEHTKAKKAFEAYLTNHPEDIDTLVNLGVVALKTDAGQEAVDYFTKALTLDEHHIDARNNLAATFMHYDRFENALTHYLILLEQDADNLEYHYNAGVAEMALGQLEKAKRHYHFLLTKNPNHFSALINLAAIEIRQSHHDLAKNLLEKAHQIHPKDEACRFMLNALSETGTLQTHSIEYTTHLFDRYALYYESHLNQVLQYQLPKHIAELLPQTAVEKGLDLGCGTGLSGLILRDICRHLTGVDLSAKMLEMAKQKAIYDQLEQQDILTFLKTTHDTYAIIVSADVLPYLSELETLFESVYQCLTDLGQFIFSVEITSKMPYVLQKNARFAHHPDYIRQLIQRFGFQCTYHNNIIARQENQQDHIVALYAIQKAVT